MKELIYYVLQNNLFRRRFRTVATSKMEHFVTIVNDFQLLTIIKKSSILDVAVVLDHLCCCTKTHVLYVLNLFLKIEDLKVTFNGREVLFRISFLKVLKTMRICIKYRQKSWKITYEWLHFIENGRHPFNVFTKSISLQIIFRALAAIFRNTYFPGHPVAFPSWHSLKRVS